MPDNKSENEVLRGEVRELRARCSSFDEKLALIRNDIAALEAHAGQLENLFIASSRLHSSLDIEETLRTVSDILRDLIGAKRYAVYLDDGVGALRAIVTDDSGTAPIHPDAPCLAAADLRLGDRTLGKVQLYELFSQKLSGLTPLDHELLKLVGEQAAPALLAARTFAGQDRRNALLKEFVRFLFEKVETE